MFARRDAASERAQSDARISILESLVERLKKGEHIPEAEIGKLIVLSRKLQKGDQVAGSSGGERIGVTWKEAVLGRNAPSKTTES